MPVSLLSGSTAFSWPDVHFEFRVTASLSGGNRHKADSHVSIEAVIQISG